MDPAVQQLRAKHCRCPPSVSVLQCGKAHEWTVMLSSRLVCIWTQQWSSHPTVPSSSSRISPVHRAFVCMWTVLVAAILSLAIVGVRPGARNWLAKAFSVGEDCERERGRHKTRKLNMRNTQETNQRKSGCFMFLGYLGCTVQLLTNKKYRVHDMENDVESDNFVNYCNLPVSLPLEVLSENLLF